MAKVEGTVTVRHETVIEMLERLAGSPDFNPSGWSLLDVERLVRFATSIQSRVELYYATKRDRDRVTGE